jgi:hypothetical protein
MGKWSHIFNNGTSGIREIHPAELLGPLCDRCTDAVGTENVDGDRLCASCAYVVRQKIANGDW